MSNFLTIDDLDKRLIYKKNHESNEQHKYSRLAMASYYYKDEDYVYNELFNSMDELDGFIRDNSLSTEEHSVFHNETTKETVISYRGTTSQDDIKTDSHILFGTERNTKRYERSEAVYQATKQKYGKDNLTTASHSLGGNLSIHIGETHDIPSFVFNPGISPSQFVSKEHHNNTNKTIIYKTRLDPVSVGAINQKNRQVNTVANSPNHHAHALENFFSDDAIQNDDGSYSIEKETTLETLTRHRNKFKKMYDVIVESRNIENYLVENELSGLNPIDYFQKSYDLYQFSKTDPSPTEFNNHIATSFNPLSFIGNTVGNGIVIDPDYHWEDKDVITPLYNLGQYLRTDQRVKEDALMNLGSTQPIHKYKEQDDGTLTRKGVTYTQVMGN